MLDISVHKELMFCQRRCSTKRCRLCSTVLAIAACEHGPPAASLDYWYGAISRVSCATRTHLLACDFFRTKNIDFRVFIHRDSGLEQDSTSGQPRVLKTGVCVPAQRMDAHWPNRTSWWKVDAASEITGLRRKCSVGLEPNCLMYDGKLLGVPRNAARS